jgi:cytoskeletal protein CcmA (bactofilin family)
MSKVRADNISNRADDGAPALTYGAEIPVGYGITGAGGINVGGAATISGNLTVGGAATISGNVSVGGTLTYEDVTNIDSVGLITARSGIIVSSNGIDAVGIVTATSFSGDGSGLSGVGGENDITSCLFT